VTPEDVARFERTIVAGGVALFPADTVYGLAADPESGQAVERIYELKGRPRGQPAAVMFFDTERALARVAGALGPRTRAALGRLLPGAVTLVLPNPDRLYSTACGPTPERLGLRVPRFTGAIEPLTAMSLPVVQSSANRSGGDDPRELAEVDSHIRGRVDLELDGNRLPGTASTVIDLTGYEADGAYELLRVGAVAPSEVAELL
jgi:L-threonylcarbamoyladenylate synthase